MTAALAVGVVGCKKDAPAKEVAQEQAHDPEAAEEAKLGPRPVDPPVSYTVKFDALLDLVPADNPHFLAVRDPSAVFSIFEPFVSVGMTALRPTLPPARTTRLDAVRTGYETAREGLGAIDPDAGMVMFSAGDAVAFAYRAEAPGGFSSLAQALGAEAPAHCAAVQDPAGWIVCAPTEAEVESYAPGRAGAKLRAEIAGRLPTVDLTRFNMLGRLGGPNETPFAIATPPGLLHIVGAPPNLPPELAGVRFEAGPAEALGLAAPGTGFVWGRVPRQDILARIDETPGLLRPLVQSLGGELFLGAIDQPDALALLVGVEDPMPAGGALSLASLQLSHAPNTLPDGSTMTVELYDVDMDGGMIRVVRAELDPVPQAERLLRQLGAEPLAWAFAAGKYAALVTGADETAVPRVAEFDRTAPRPSVLRSLPLPLAESLAAERAGFVLHVPVDVVGSDRGSELLRSTLASWPESARPMGASPESLAAATEALLRPLSSVSSWMEPGEGTPLTHIAISTLGDARTPDGKAALDALLALDKGKGTHSAVFSTLAESHGQTPRGRLYRSRAEPQRAEIMGSMLTLGLAIALVTPALMPASDQGT